MPREKSKKNNPHAALVKEQKQGMPIENIVPYGGRLYCYDSETRTVTRYDPTQMNLSDCPDFVLIAFMENEAKKKEKT